MPIYESESSINTVVELFNKRLYNAGYSFKVIEVSEYRVYVQASFDFSYYVNVHLEFEPTIFTNLQENNEWPDAWYNNQLFILTKDEIASIKQNYHLENILKEKNDAVFGFQFNINGRGVKQNGIVLSNKLYVRWEHPYYD